MGDWYADKGDSESALKFFSLALHTDPYNYELRDRIDAIKQKHGGKKAVSMCKWRGNIFTQTHEMSTSLGMVHAMENRIQQSIIFFFSTVRACVHACVRACVSARVRECNRLI